MTEAGFGHIVNITSRAALGKKQRTAYAASKAGLIESTQVLYVCGGLTVGLVLG
jgi:3-oxoacyl-[acyl-carrier protein] reductase